MTILIESLKFRTNSRIIALIPVIYCEKCEYEFFEYYAIILKFIVTDFKDRFTSYVTTMFSLGLSVISKDFFADLSMCLFAGKDIAQELLLF